MAVILKGAALKFCHKDRLYFISVVQNLRRLLASAEPFSWQAEGPQSPFGLLFTPCRSAEALSQG